jgi:CMP-N,N'-diacetyllegionaminic acid synthase
MRTLGIIPARGGSKGLPRKNVLPLAGKPLLAWTAEAALRGGLDRVILSSDDPEIQAVARQCGVEVPFSRPPELARDETPGIDVVVHAVRTLAAAGYRPDAVMLLQPTSPLRTAADISSALKLLREHPEADSLVSVVKAPHNSIPETLMRLGPDGFLAPVIPWDERKNLRQAKPVYYARNGAAIYLVRTARLLDANTLYGERILAYEMAKQDSFDIDDIVDFGICEYLLSQREEGRRFAAPPDRTDQS